VCVAEGRRLQVALIFFFFFSSRRRHTRLQGDWSSDVCSSDLRTQRLCGALRLSASLLEVVEERRIVAAFCDAQHVAVRLAFVFRSEERRVGKECRCGWGPGGYKKKRWKSWVCVGSLLVMCGW